MSDGEKRRVTYMMEFTEEEIAQIRANAASVRLDADEWAEEIIRLALKKPEAGV